MKEKNKKFVEGDKKSLLSLGFAGAGASLVTAGATYPFRKKITLDPAAKRVAILFPGHSSGAGHATPAKVLQNEFLKNNIQVDMYNLEDYQNVLTKNIFAKSYVSNVSVDPVQHMPSETRWDPNNKFSLPEKLERHSSGISTHNSNIFNTELGKELWNSASGHSSLIEDLRKKKYSRVLAMHGTTANMLKELKVPVEVVATDFVPDPFVWKTDAASKYYVATEEAKRRLQILNIPEEKISKVDSLIVNPILKTPESINIPEDIVNFKKNGNRLVTVMGGSTGIQIDKIGEAAARHYLKRDLSSKVIVITGNNKEAYQTLSNKVATGELPNLIVKGNTPALGYIKHSDIFITRPGGSSTAEALHAGTPTITYNHADVANTWEGVGSHEHGNVKVLHSNGMSRHFQTKYVLPNTEHITNFEDLGGVIDDVENNYNTLKKAALETSNKYKNFFPERAIVMGEQLMHRPSQLSILNKLKIGAGIGALISGSYLYKNRRDKTDKPIIKIGKMTTTEKTLTGVGAGVVGTGIIGSALFPELRGKFGPVLGVGPAIKKIFHDLPINTIKNRSFMRAAQELVGMPVGTKEVTPILKLTPTLIVEMSKNMAKEKIPDFESLSNLEQRLVSKKYDTAASKKIIEEHEKKLRAAKISKMIGISHFSPSIAARNGFVESRILSPTAFKLLTEYGPLDYYKTERINTLKKLKDSKLDTADAMDAYWLTAPRNTLRFFEKDLTVPNEVAMQRASDAFNKIPAEKKEFIDKAEKVFKKKYDRFVEAIERRKDANRNSK